MPNLPSDIDVMSFAISVNGTTLDNKYGVVSIVVHREINRIPFARIMFEDGDSAKATFEVSESDEFKPGNEIVIEAGYKSENKTIFKGDILSQKIKVSRSSSGLVVEARHKASQLAHVTKNRLFVDKKDSDVVSEILGECGISNGIEATKATHPCLVQHHCCDWDFVLSRMQANGQVLLLNDDKITGQEPKLTEKSVLTLKYGTDIFELEAEVDARRQIDKVTTRSWSYKDQKVEETDAKEPKLNDQGDLTPDKLAAASGKKALVANHSDNRDDEERQAWADGLLLGSRLSKIRGRVCCQGYAGILPGDLLTLEGLGKRFNGDAYVSAIRHEISNGNWITDIQFGLEPDWFLGKKGPQGSNVDHLLPGIGGLHIAKVKKISDDPDGEDRIMVNLPLVHDDENEGIWARIATLDAGNNRGSFFRPEVDDEVVVGFFNDDPRSPVVLGMVNSSANPAPVTPEDDTNPLKGFYTRSEMKLIFDDEKKIITISTPEGNKLELSEEDASIILQDQNNNKMEMSSAGITIKSCKDLTLDAPGDITVKATGKISLNATGDITQDGMNVTINAKTGFTAKGNATAEVSASGNTTVKGAMVMIN